MAEAGYFGILIPEEYGGLGLGVFEYCIIAEQLARQVRDEQARTDPPVRPPRRG